MNLFMVKNEVAVVPKVINPLFFNTPLGKIQFDCSFDQKSLSKIHPQTALTINSKSFLLSWLFQECHIEFLHVYFTPNLPLGMHVEKCFAGVWRIKNLHDNNAFTFKCSLNSPIEASPEPGEGLFAISFEDQHTKLTIGAEDEEKLITRSNKKNWLPLHFKETLQPENLRYLKQGIEIELPNCRQNEFLQIHFVVAWASKADKELSTWYAVDQSMENILLPLNIK